MARDTPSIFDHHLPLLCHIERELTQIKHTAIFSSKDEIPFEKIEKANHEIIQLIRKSEGDLRDIMSFRINNEVDDKIRKNVHYSLAIQLRDVTQRAKKFEKELVKMIRQQWNQGKQ